MHLYPNDEQKQADWNRSESASSVCGVTTHAKGALTLATTLTLPLGLELRQNLIVA